MITNVVMTDTTKMKCAVCDKTHKHIIGVKVKKKSAILCQNCFYDLKQQIEHEKRSKQ